MIVNGVRKADMVARCLEGPITSQITATAIQLHSGDITVVLDEAAAARLKNVEHYRFVEKIKNQYGL